MRTTTYKKDKARASKVMAARILLFLALIGIGATSGLMIHAHAMNPGDAEAANAPAMAAAFSDAVEEEAVSTSKLCVEPGDTLWSIAKQYGPEGVSPKKYVQQILAANDLDSAALSVGQVLILP